MAKKKVKVVASGTITLFEKGFMLSVDWRGFKTNKQRDEFVKKIRDGLKDDTAL